MGGCCAGNSYKIEHKSELSMKNLPISNIRNSVSSFSEINEDFLRLKRNPKFILEANSLKNLGNNIKKVISENPSFQIFPINLEQIWNIAKYYQNDFTNSKYILYDLRPKELKKENVLKKFKCISYSIDDIESFTEDRLILFKKFLFQKFIIIIPFSENLTEVSRVLQIFLEQNIYESKIYVLAYILNESIMYSPQILNLYHKMDDRTFFDYPNILFPLKVIPYLRNPNYIFIDKFQNKLKETYLNVNNESFKFLLDFRIKIILYITMKVEELQIQSFNGVYYISLPYELDKEDKITRVINMVKGYLYTQNGIIIIYDEFENKETLSNWLAIIFNDIFYNNSSNSNKGAIFNDIINSMCIFDKMFSASFIRKFQSENSKALEKKYDISEEKKDKIRTEIQSLYLEIGNENAFLSNLIIFERIILNILNHPHNQLYYVVKKESHTFKNSILGSKHVLYIFLLFGFQENLAEKAYHLSIDTDLTDLQSLYDFFVACIRKLIQ